MVRRVLNVWVPGLEGSRRLCSESFRVPGTP